MLRFALLAFALVSCDPVVDVLLPPIDEDTASILLVVEHDGGITVHGIPAPEQASRQHLVQEEGTLQIWTILYRESLEELGLPEGEIPTARSDQPFIGIPQRFSKLYRAEVDGTSVDLSEVDELGESLENLRLLVKSPLECLRGGGCYASTDACTTPCPEPDSPTPPDAPTLPELPCPTGWRAVTSDDLDWCDPWPTSGVQRCGPGQAHFPGTSDCEQVGPDCPALGWPEEIPSGATVRYVRADASAGGSGTRTSPFNQINSALSGISSGTIIVVAEGDYAESISLPADITIWGACASGVRLLDPGSGTAIVRAQGRNTALKNITLSGDRPGLRVDSSATIAVENLIVDGTRGEGLVVFGELVGNNIVVRDSRGTNGAALRVSGTAVISRAHFSDFEDLGVEVSGSASVSLSNCAVRRGTDHQAFGVRSSGGSVTLQRCVVSETAFIAIVGNNAELTLTDVLVQDTSPHQDHGQGAGIVVDEGSTATGERVVVQNSLGFGVTVEEGSTLQLHDLVVLETRGRANVETAGIGLLLNGGNVELTRGYIERSRSKGVLIHERSTGVLDDLTVKETLGQTSDGGEGIGIEVLTESSFTGSRIRIEGSQGLGLLAGDAGTALALTDVSVHDTRPRLSNNAFGRGVELNSAALGSIDRLRVTESKNIGVIALDLATKLTLTDVYVSDTTESGCFGFSCATALADGMGANLGSSIEAERFLIENNAHYGVRTTHPFFVLKNGVVRGNAVGALIAAEGFDFRQIAQQVRFEDNGESITVIAPE